MPFVIFTLYLGKPMYFCYHPFETGFTISTNTEIAKTYDSRKEAKEIAGTLSFTTGMDTDVEHR
jgi:hypothetical protein